MPTPLLGEFLSFAKGMPAIAISWDQIGRDVASLASTLAGTNPGQPSVFTANIPMPVYGLAYSVFVGQLTLAPTGDLTVQMTANVHPAGHPDQVIRSYHVATNPTASLSLELDSNTNEVYWIPNGSAPPTITPSWGPNAVAILNGTTIPDPKQDHYLQDVETPLLWLTAPSFVNLVAGLLPRYRLGEIVSWIQFLPPIRVDLSSTHVLVTSSQAMLMIGDCTPQSVPIVPDPDFPYGVAIPPPSGSGFTLDFAVYAPKTRLLQFFAATIEPAVVVSDSGGGVIKWSIAGSIGLKSIVVDLLTVQGTTGVIEVAASLDFVAAARAWIDGPCGVQLSLASASVLGNGNFAGDIAVSVDVSTGTVEASLTVTKSALPNVSWDLNTPLKWPLNQIADYILNYVSQNEVGKLAGEVTQIGRWQILGFPLFYLNSLAQGEQFFARAEGLAGVAGMMGIYHRKP